MKIAFYSESEADEEVLRIFTEALLGSNIERTELGFIRHRVMTQKSKDQLNRQKKNLKTILYGTETVSLELEKKIMMKSANSLVPSLNLIEQYFPLGFREMAKTIRSWK